MVTDARVAVAGGSLGGLTAALLLRDLGLDVTVYERAAAELEERGAGIGFLPASYRYLVERAGVALDDISVVTYRIRYLARDGTVIHDEPHTYRFSSWNTVYRQLLGCFGRERYRLGHEVEGFDQHSGGVDLELSGGRRDSVDLLVCADGVGSRSRRALLPQVDAQYAGYVAWRGTVPEGSLPAAAARALGDAITYFVYANSHILVYPIPGRDGSVAPGERLINFVWYRNYLDGGDLAEVLTDGDGQRHEVSLPPGAARPEHVAEVRATAAARLPELIAEVVHAVPAPFLQVIVDVEVPRMAFGRVCLVGDAAWAVRPHAAAGTAKAADDAWALAAALADHGDVGSALAAWEPGRLELGRALLERTRSIGRRSQVDGTWVPGDPELIFGLYGPGQ
ncbi:MAG TPA: FAD-dependent monooxygenase [Acidimicrobiales bacterium]|nr:FAD-dependent monooxygenase [Acidimicrobiales bacterium]